VTIDEYFSSVARCLHRKANVDPGDPVFECIASDDLNGMLRCRAVFWNRSFLDIYEVVTTELGYPVRVYYSYAYMSRGECVFRYDNAPHHPEIPTHPHHKHVQGRVSPLPCDMPSLNRVIREIEELLRA
jgi:hypothetical protein